MKRMLGGCLLAVAALVAPPAGAEPWNAPVALADSSVAAVNTCYATLGNTNPNGGALIRINLATGAGTLIGPTGIIGSLGDRGVPALAIRSGGEMYAMDIGQPAKLYRLSAKTGTATLVATTGLRSPPAMVFDGFDVLNVIDASGKLYTVDIGTGDTTLVGPTNLAIRGLTVDPTDGQLWASDASGGIYKLDAGTAAPTLVGNTGLPASPDLCFDEAGTLYAVSGGGLSTNQFITINKTTGEGAAIGPIGFQAVSGMAIRCDEIVPTLVQTFAAHWRADHVELRWRVMEDAGTAIFSVERAAGGGGYEPVAGAGIARDGPDFVFRDAAVDAGGTYRYRVLVLEEGARVTLFETAVLVPAHGASLEQNHPNPFAGATRIRYGIPRAGRVSLTVHDVTGRLVRVLVDRRVDAGVHAEAWDGRDTRGDPAGSGLYFYRLEAGDRVWTRRMVRID